MEIKIESKTVLSNEGGFEPHPESYTPRVFAAVWERGAKVYEILQNGQAIPWPCLPIFEGFDYWVLYVEHLSDVDMHRAPKPKVQKFWAGTNVPYSEPRPAFLHPDPVPQADGYSDSGTLPEDVTWVGEIDGKRYTGLGPKSGNLDHLPEGSY
jgi:hypothetical protein